MTESDDPAAVGRAGERDSTSRPAVSDHRVFLFYPFRIDPGKARTRDMSWFGSCLKAAHLSDLCRTPMMPSWVRESADATNGDVWRPCKRVVSLDLRPQVRRLAGHADTLEADDGHFELTTAAVNILTGRLGARGLGLHTVLTKASTARLRADAASGETHDRITATVLIEGATVQFWNTGAGILVLELSYRSEQVADAANLVLELNHALCRSGEKAGSAPSSDSSHCANHWQRRTSRTEIEEQPGPTLDAIVLALIDPASTKTIKKSGELLHPKGAGIHPDWLRDARIMAYSYVQFAEPLPDALRQQYAIRLCRRYTLDYAVNTAEGAGTLYAPFANVLHAASIEGGCVVTHALSDVPHIRDFLTAAVKPAYLPLVIVAFHEYRHLLQLAQSSIEPSAAGHSLEQEWRRLSQLVEDFAHFKLNFHVSQASQVSHHNEVDALWRRTFRLDTLLEDSTQSVAQAHARLSERRWRAYGTLGTFVGVYLTLTEAVRVFFDIVLGHGDLRTIAQINAYQYGGFMDKLDELQRTMLLEQRIGHVTALVAAAWIAWLVYRKAPHKH